MIDAALAHNIQLYQLPPHTTHRLQPLDVGVFGPLQKGWAERCDEILEETGYPMEIHDVVKEYMAVRKESFKSETILQAWRKSGLRPLDPSIFTEKDFAPSWVLSTQLHLPTSFPTVDLSDDDSDSDSDSESELESGADAVQASETHILRL